MVWTRFRAAAPQVSRATVVLPTLTSVLVKAALERVSVLMEPMSSLAIAKLDTRVRLAARTSTSAWVLTVAMENASMPLTHSAAIVT
jgi:hypothetical protein